MPRASTSAKKKPAAQTTQKERINQVLDKFDFDDNDDDETNEDVAGSSRGNTRVQGPVKQEQSCL